MIEINLLPHREARRVADLRETVAVLVLGSVCVTGGIYFANKSVADELSQAQTMVRQLESDIERYKPQEAKVEAFKKQRQQLEDKLAVIEGLDKARSGPVRILDELSQTTPERLWLTSLSKDGGKIIVEGQSIDTGVVADFLRALNHSEYFVNVDLDRTGRGAEVDGVRLVSFVITAGLRTPPTSQES